MSAVQQRRQADEMRAAGASLRAISAELGISKGTLSYWYSERSRARTRARQAAKRAENKAKGLTTKGAEPKPIPPRKPRPRPVNDLTVAKKRKPRRKVEATKSAPTGSRSSATHPPRNVLRRPVQLPPMRNIKDGHSEEPTP